MPLVYPLAQSIFFDRLPIRSFSLELAEHLEVSRTGSGDVLSADLGDRLWQGRIELGSTTPAEVGQIHALITALRQAGRTFLLHDRDQPFPADDPNGVELTDAAPTIGTRPPEANVVRFRNLPPFYRLRAGDTFGYSYGGDRLAMHRLVEDATASSLGNTPDIEVVPHLRLAAVEGTAVTFGRPAIKAMIEPGSTEVGSRRNRHRVGTSFSFVQVTR